MALFIYTIVLSHTQMPIHVQHVRAVVVARSASTMVYRVIEILRLWSIANLVLDIVYIWLHQLYKTKKHGSAIYHSAWIIFICIRCCRQDWLVQRVVTANI